METPERIRLDKWLWAARFFKTRSLAARAIEAGHARVAGERVKPAREIRPGDRLEIHAGEQDWEIVVLALSLRRGPAPEAQRLYAEAPEAMARRQARLEARRLALEPGAGSRGRPTKRDRRLIHRFTDAG